MRAKPKFDDLEVYPGPEALSKISNLDGPGPRDLVSGRADKSQITSFSRCSQRFRLWLLRLDAQQPKSKIPAFALVDQPENRTKDKKATKVTH